MHVSTGVYMNFCKFLETLKSEINSLCHLKITQKSFWTGQHCFWKYCKANSFSDFPRHYRKTSSEQNKIYGNVSLRLFRYLYCVSRLYCCSERVSDGWASSGSCGSVNKNFQVIVHKDGGNEDWIFVSVILKYQILLWQISFKKYDFDQCQRKKRRDSFLWTVVAPQRHR